MFEDMEKDMDKYNKENKHGSSFDIGLRKTSINVNNIILDSITPQDSETKTAFKRKKNET